MGGTSAAISPRVDVTFLFSLKLRRKKLPRGKEKNFDSDSSSTAPRGQEISFRRVPRLVPDRGIDQRTARVRLEWIATFVPPVVETSVHRAPGRAQPTLASYRRRSTIIKQNIFNLTDNKQQGKRTIFVVPAHKK